MLSFRPQRSGTRIGRRGWGSDFCPKQSMLLWPLKSIRVDSRERYRSKLEIRSRMLTHFPYFVVFAVREADCVVIAIAHAARRPGYWRERLA